MAASAGKGYKSNIDIQLSQLPKTTDAAIFNDLTEAYNAIHILNASVDSVINGLYKPDKDLNPDEAMKFIRSFWAEASEDIEIGCCVRWADGGDSVRKGHAGAWTGFSLTDAKEGDLIQVAYGPAILQLDGIKAGDWIWTTDSRGDDENEFRGKLLEAGTLDGSAKMGRALVNGWVMFMPAWCVETVVKNITEIHYDSTYQNGSNNG